MSSPPPSSSFSSSSARICKHMNEDHPSSVLSFALHYCKIPTATHATVIDVTEEGFVLSIEGIEEPKLAKFPENIEGVKDVRRMAVMMHEESFSSLGLIHRLRHGYYSSKYLKYKKYVMSVAAVTVGLGGITAVALFRRKRIK
ncbi:hypothetical protein TrVE_jg10529 [Triparma verrucosa]|uniref:DUF2470 domain-containing protein n=1 Tax=Triparma verrucosa TaxID=1606542 RepID=A0A9W7FM83_9STRA|nr:hypothetical protein TrVE_jg10529 [Triparma verrucosa]